MSSNADKGKDVVALVISCNPEVERTTDNVRAVAGQVGLCEYAFSLPTLMPHQTFIFEA